MIAYQQVIDEIRILLQSGETVGPDHVRRLAPVYHTACQEANQRLHRCADLLAKGLRSEAIHIAQTEPNLLDCISTLDFPERKQWEQLCQVHGAPPPPNLNLESATLLNEAYADDQPLEELLRKHRLLALARAPLGNRLALLRRIAELDPRNPAWDDDIRTFERARIQQYQNELDGVIQRGQMAGILAAANELTSPRWRVTPPVALVNKAQRAAKQFEGMKVAAALRELEVKLNDAMTTFNVPRAVSLRDQWNQLINVARPAPNDPVWARISVVLDWVEQQVRRQADETAFQGFVAEFEQALQQPRSPEELETIHNRVAQLGRGIPEQLEARYQTAMRRFRSAARRRKLLFIGVPLLVLAATSAGGVWYWQYQAEQDKINTAVNSVRQLIDAGQFADAQGYLENLDKADPLTAQKRPVLAVKDQLYAAQRNEEDRLLAFKDALEQAKTAPLDAVGDRLVEKAENLSRLPDEKSTLHRLSRSRKAQKEEQRLAHEKTLTPQIEELSRSVGMLEEMLKKPFDAQSVSGLLAQHLKQANDLGAKANAASESTQDTLRTLTKRLDAARNTIRHSGLEALVLDQVTRSLNEKQPVAAFVKAAENYVQQFADTARAKDFKTALTEHDHWQAVLAWQTVVEPGSIKGLDVASKDAIKLAESARKYAADHPQSANSTLIEQYLKALDAAARRSEADPKGAPADLRKIFASLVVRDVWMLREADGKVYYSSEDLKAKVKDAADGRISLKYLIGYDGRTRSKPLPLGNISKVGLAPQAAIADSVRFLTENFAEKNWDDTIMSFAQKIRDAKEMDPILQMILLQQVLECGAKGSYPLAVALKGHLELFEKSRVDLTVPWLDPENQAAQKERPRAREFVNQLPLLDRVAKTARDEKQALAGALNASVRTPVGWLNREQANAWQVASPAKLPDGADLYIIVPTAGQPAAWHAIGKAVKGKAMVQSAKGDVLLEGRLVFASKP